MSRRNAREIAFKLVFEYMFSHEQKPELIDEYVADFKGVDKDDDTAFVKEVYFGVVSKFDELNSLLAENVQNFELERLFNADRAALLLALYEIKFMSDVPYKVSVDEAIGLVKKYSTEKSSKYVNGVLAKFSGEK